jgi:hypothetical protein
MLARILGTRASLEHALGHQSAAAEFTRTALRFGYVRPDPGDIANDHHNLAICLGVTGGDRVGQRAHRLAAALIYRLADMIHDQAVTRRELAAELREDGTADARLPDTLAEVVRVAELTDGVRLGVLLAALQSDPSAVEAALAQILRNAADLPAYDDVGIARHLEQWEPVIADVAAACGGDQDAATRLGPYLDEQAKHPDWAALAAVLRRILNGERGDALLVRQPPIASWPGCSRVAGVCVCGTSGIVPGGGGASGASGRRGRAVLAGRWRRPGAAGFRGR